jgi:hypothetical protein
MDQQTVIYIIITIVIFILLGGGIYYYMKHKTENFDNPIQIPNTFTFAFVFNNGIIKILNDIQGNIYCSYTQNDNNILKKPILLKIDENNIKSNTPSITLSGFPQDNKSYLFTLTSNNDGFYSVKDSNNVVLNIVNLNFINVTPFYQNIDFEVQNLNSDLDLKLNQYMCCYLRYNYTDNKWSLFNSGKEGTYKENKNFSISSLWIDSNNLVHIY